MLHPINKTEDMTDILLLSSQVSYNGKVPKAEEHIDGYKDQSVESIRFVYNTDAAAAGADMGIKKYIVDLL